MAGADRPVEKELFQQWATESTLAGAVIVSNDALPVIYAAFSDGVGIGLIAGTGSLAIGRTDDERIQRCGGWGGLFGDEGSGYAIAMAALRAAARDEDQRGPPTGLRQRLLGHLRVTTLNDAIQKLYDPDTRRADLAALAPLVFDAAEENDSVAIQIIEQAATELSELVLTLIRRLHLSDQRLRLALTGSVLLNQEQLANQIVHHIRQSHVQVADVVKVRDSVQGAINMAALAVRS